MTEHTPSLRPGTRAVVLVEGVSDRAAVEALALRRGRDLRGEGVSVVPIGGAQAIGRVLERLGPHGLDLALAGLCDAAEEVHFRRGVERAGLGAAPTRNELERRGFYVCEADLEDELTRALGPDRLLRVIEGEGELSAFRTFQKQPEKRPLPLAEQLHAFMWNRKLRYARLLVEALELDEMPRPLARVLEHV